MIKQDNLSGLYKFGDLLKYQSRAKLVQESRVPTGRQERNDGQDRISTAHGNEHAGITPMISCEIPQQIRCSFGGVMGLVFCLFQGPKVTSVRTIKHIHTTPMKISLGMRYRKA